MQWAYKIISVLVYNIMIIQDDDFYMQCQRKPLHYYFSCIEANRGFPKWSKNSRILAESRHWERFVELSDFPNACTLILIFHVNGFLGTTWKRLMTEGSLFHEADPLLMVCPRLPRCPLHSPLHFTCLFCSLYRDFRVQYEAHRPRFILGSTT